MAATPLVNALSRRNERRADRYALTLTRQPAAFISAMKRLGTQNLAEEHPSRPVLWLFHTHPPIEQRIEAAREFPVEFLARRERMPRPRLRPNAPCASANVFPMNPALSFVIPLYNAAATIAPLVHDIEQLQIDGGHEIVLVNDGSGDDTSEVCRDLVRTARVPITLVEHARNFGEHNAVLTGWRHARGAHIVNLDDDGQNPPREAVRLWQHALATGARCRLRPLRGQAALGFGAMSAAGSPTG